MIIHSLALQASPWQWLLIAVGTLALVAVTASLFLPDWNVPEFESAFDAPPGTPAFTAGISQLLNLPRFRGGELALLENGDAFYPEMLRAIRSARESVNFQVYIFEPDETGREFMEAFKERARAGVEVRVLFDGFGGHQMESGHARELEEAGCKVGFFRPIRPWTLVRAFKRDHRRAIVVDGRVGFTGGAAVADKWRGKAEGPGRWRDNMVRVTGPLVAGIQTAFAENWVYATGEVLTGPRFYACPTLPLREADALDDDEAPEGLALVSSPGDAHQPMRLLFWLGVSNARERLLISTSYFVPDARLRRALAARARAGVDVRVLLPGGYTDAKPVRLAARGYYEELLRAGVRIYEYQPTMMHAKAVVADGRWCVIGSANLDQRSMKWNEENILAVADRRLAAELERSILADLERSREIRLEEWRRRSPFERLAEGVCKTLVEQY